MKLSIRAKLLASAGLLMSILAAMGIASVVAAGALTASIDDMNTKAALPLAATGDMQTMITDEQQQMLRGFVNVADAAAQTDVDKVIAADETAIAADMKSLADMQASVAVQGQVTVWKEYYALFQSARNEARTATKANDTARANTAINSATAAFDKANGAVEQLQQFNVAEAAATVSSADGTAGLLRLLIVVFLIAGISIGAIISLRMAHGFSQSVKAVQASVDSLANNCATWLAEGLERLRDNDLTYSITPVTPRIDKYSGDEIGETAQLTDLLRDRIVSSIEAYNEARDGLAGTVREVLEAATQVSRTSADLHNAANQSGTASSQIAATISQVAAGASEQARAASETSDASVQLSAIIAQVGAGAADTSGKVEVAAEALEQMADAIQNASGASDEVKSVAADAAAAAEHGQKAVRDTVGEMDRIRDTVEAASARVTELGAKGEQIGAIVEVIDDIAEQTNLLALNAAIEAARAGEQGKGFAVVADEVRKLAERSSRATKEIASLIAEVQNGTNEAVAAMQSGAAEVEHGSRLAADAGASLDEIARSVDATRAAVVRIAGAVEAMTVASQGVVAVSDQIAQIATQTNSAAARMTDSADAVARSVQAIAAISEENSASAEEVSAATEEMSAQAEEVVASATALAQMARRLDELVGQFQLEGGRSATLARATGAVDLASRNRRSRAA